MSVQEITAQIETKSVRVGADRVVVVSVADQERFRRELVANELPSPGEELAFQVHIEFQLRQIVLFTHLSGQSWGWLRGIA